MRPWPEGQSLDVEARVSDGFLPSPGPLHSAEGGSHLLRWSQPGMWTPETGAAAPEGRCILWVLSPLGNFKKAEGMEEGRGASVLPPCGRATLSLPLGALRGLMGQTLYLLLRYKESAFITHPVLSACSVPGPGEKRRSERGSTGDHVGRRRPCCATPA